MEFRILDGNDFDRPTIMFIWDNGQFVAEKGEKIETVISRMRAIQSWNFKD